MITRSLICSLAVALLLAQSALAERMWTSESGNFTVEADLIEVRQNEVVLRRKADGRFLLVELSALSEADRRHVDEIKPAGGVVFNSELQATLDQARDAVASRSLPRAGQLMAQASQQARTPAEQQQVSRASRLVADVQRFWEAYRAALSKIEAGHELSIGEATYNVVDNQPDALLIKTARGAVRFDPQDIRQMPAKLAITIVEKDLSSAADRQRIVGAFENADGFAAGDSADRDRQLWQAALAAASSSSADPSNPGVAARPPNFGEEPPPQAEKLLPAPSAEEQDAARKLIRELYKDDFANTRRDDQKTALAGKLYLEAQQKSIDDAAIARYVMISDAANLVAETGNISEALSYFDALEGHFQESALVAPKAAALASASRVQKDAQTHFNVIEICYNNFAAAVQNDDFDAVDKLVDSALAAARMLKDRKLQVQIDKKKDELDQLQSDYRDARDALKVLSNTPDDGDANLLAGRYYCLAKGDWETGLAYLAKGSDAELAGTAEKDLAGKENAEEQAAAAEIWWRLSEAGPYSKYKKNLQARAASLYEKALPALKDLAKVAAETRIKQVQEAAAAEVFRAPQIESVPLADQPVLATIELRPPLGGSTSRPVATATINGKQFPNSVWTQPAVTDGRRKSPFGSTRNISCCRESSVSTTAASVHRFPPILRGAPSSAS